jgi:molybdenum cofactor cytidylyltransferase
LSQFAAVVLAAGQGSRFRDGGGHAASKLVADLQGKPLVRHVVEAALRSKAAMVVVVTGHQQAALEGELRDLPVRFAHNHAFATGLSSSLRAAVDVVPDALAGIIVLLGDMPTVRSDTVDRLIDAATKQPDIAAVVPTFNGKRGNPVLLGRQLFPALRAGRGDAGARALLRLPNVKTLELPIDDPGILQDVDHPRDLEALSSSLTAR